ncbi:hypothetical protein C8R45DRAFT_927332 [Mycena sanguinolenta]|nr:hypothetical protein C8R45DRAFT_927332 [Mycena sanguinolenta]
MPPLAQYDLYPVVLQGLLALHLNIHCLAGLPGILLRPGSPYIVPGGCYIITGGCYLLSARAYARPIDPAYAAKLASGDFAIHNPAHQSTVYKRAQTKPLEVHWWHQDREAAEVFIVQAPGFPHFHPKDCLAITDFLGGEVKAQMFAYWSGQHWIRTDLPVTVKYNTPLYLRSSNVTHCVDGPTATAKCKLSASTHDSSESPPLHRTRTQSYIPDLDRLEPLVFSGSSSSTSATPTVIDLTDETDETDQQISIPHQVMDVFSTGSSGGSTRTSTSPSKISWPLKYFCDTHAGFVNMATSPAQNVSTKFRDTFKLPFVHTTYYNNIAKWRSLSADQQNQAIAHGRAPEGEWAHIFKNYNTKGKSKAL